ncbi:MAG: hypothetical protein C4344_07820 [Acidimicrobiia bacterium]
MEELTRQSASFRAWNQTTARMRGKWLGISLKNADRIQAALSPPCSTEAVSLTMMGRFERAERR